MRRRSLPGCARHGPIVSGVPPALGRSASGGRRVPSGVFRAGPLGFNDLRSRCPRRGCMGYRGCATAVSGWASGGVETPSGGHRVRARADRSCPLPSPDHAAATRDRRSGCTARSNAHPRIFRTAVVLCYFEGLTLDEAARRLRCPAGTLRSRLARAGEAADQLDPPWGGIARTRRAPSSRGRASASVPPFLCDSTTRAAIQFAASYAAGGSRPLLPRPWPGKFFDHACSPKIKLTAILLLPLDVGRYRRRLGRSALAMKEESTQNPAASTADAVPHAVDRPRPATKPDPATAGRMMVTGAYSTHQASRRRVCRSTSSRRPAL